MHRITIDLPLLTFERLIRGALIERRSTRDQAAVLIERALGLRPAYPTRIERQATEEQQGDAGC